MKYYCFNNCIVIKKKMSCMDANLIQQVVQLMIFIIDVFKNEVLDSTPPHLHPISHILFPDPVAAGQELCAFG